MSLLDIGNVLAYAEMRKLINDACFLTQALKGILSKKNTFQASFGSLLVADRLGFRGGHRAKNGSGAALYKRERFV